MLHGRCYVAWEKKRKKKQVSVAVSACGRQVLRKTPALQHTIYFSSRERGGGGGGKEGRDGERGGGGGGS